jgi:transposase
MAKALANDLRRRVIGVIDGGLSCREAAERFGVSVSSAIRWLDRLKKQGDVAAKRQGGDRKSGRIEAEAAFLLGEVAETPDITLVELQEKLQARGVSAGASATSATVAQERDPADRNNLDPEAPSQPDRASAMATKSHTRRRSWTRRRQQPHPPRSASWSNRRRRRMGSHSSFSGD